MGDLGVEMFDVTTPADLAGAAFESRVRQQSRVLRDELIRQTLQDAGSWTRAVEDKWANDHPDLAPIFPVTEEEIARYRDRVQHADYEWVVPAFEQFVVPDPDQLIPVIDALAQVEATFGGKADPTGEWAGSSPSLLRINDVRTDIDEWAGAFKNSFIDNFLTPLQGTLPNHAELARITGDQMKLTKVVYIRQRKSVLELLDNAIKATKALSNSACSPEDAFKWATIMMVATGTIVGAYATGVGVAATGLCLEVAGTIGQGLVPDPEERQKSPLAAPTATEVAANVSQAISRLTGDVHQQEQVAVSALQSLHRVVEKERLKTVSSNAASAFAVSAPPLAAATPGQIMEGFFPDD